MAAAQENVLRCRSNISPWFLLLALLGCAESHNRAVEPDKPAGDFESDSADGLSEGIGGGGDVRNDDPGDGTGPQWDDALNIIGNADVVQLEGDRLYALSRVAGLSVIDVSNPDVLRILGRYRELPAEPLALDVRDGVAIAAFSGWGQYAANDAGDYEWVEASKVVALDAANPAEIMPLGSFEVPGSIGNARFAGGALYLVTQQNGMCWGCEQGRGRTAVLSLDVSDPRDLRQVDELVFDDTTNPTDVDTLSIVFGEQRLYVAGLGQGTPEPRGSTIQVIDISDPGGHMVEGDRVEVAERISLPEVMDEYEGVLRVISQPPDWDAAHPTRVQTFRVVSSADLQPLGSTTLVFPREEQAHHVRFDGPRAYASPFFFDLTDRLFTIDLSDPAQPAQGATLQLEERDLLQDMHPRGDRFLGLNVTPDNRGGSITLYDMSDLANPSLIDRLSFGADLGFPHGIGSTFEVLDEAGLILAPFGGTNWDDGSGEAYCGTYRGGLQLIDFDRDALSVRGKTRVDDSVQMILLQDRLLTVGVDRVENIDITDRDAPRTRGKVLLTRDEKGAYPLENGSVARLYLDRWSGAPSIDFVAAAEADEPNAGVGALDLREALGTDLYCEQVLTNDYMPLRTVNAFARGDHIEIVYYAEEQFYGLAIIDGSDPTAPKVLSNTTWPYEPDWWWHDGYGAYSYGYYGYQKALVHTDSAIVMLERGSAGETSVQQRLRVLDVSDPSAPRSSLLDLPETQPYSGLIAVGDAVVTSHIAVSDGGADRARFYLDRFDLSDPTRLVQADPVNIPGALMHVDQVSGDLLISELVRQESQADTTEACFERYAFPDRKPEDVVSWEGPAGPCVGYTQRLHLVSVDAGVATLEDTLTFEDDEHVRSVAEGDGVVFVSVGFAGYYYGDDRSIYGDVLGCYERTSCGYGDGVARPGELLTLAGFGKGRLEAGRLTAESQDGWHGFWGTTGVYAAGKRALLVSHDELAIVDANDASNPTLVRTEPAYGTPHSVQISSTGEALLTFGLGGVQRVDLQ